VRSLPREQVLLADERLRYLISSTSAVIHTAKISGDYGANFMSDNEHGCWLYERRDYLEGSISGLTMSILKIDRSFYPVAAAFLRDTIRPSATFYVKMKPVSGCVTR
jgi:hypothetical protein